MSTAPLAEVFVPAFAAWRLRIPDQLCRPCCGWRKDQPFTNIPREPLGGSKPVVRCPRDSEAALQLAKWIRPSLQALEGHKDFWLGTAQGPRRGAFNDQRGRIAIVRSIIETVRPVALVETGTWRGATAEFLASFGLPTFSVELRPRTFGYARARLFGRRNVKLRMGDSRAALRHWLATDLRKVRDRPLFFYLDAHWNADLPLAEELQIIFNECPRAVVMVDDFEVPHDAAYGFDDYGPGQAFTADYIEPVVAAFGLLASYPALPAAEETGAKQGCVVLVRAASSPFGTSALPPLLRA
jgi:hypothetical protein